MSNYDKVFDVIVCGGGTSGIAAAIAAARTGASTLLVERMGALGGQLSVSGPPGFAFAHLFNPRGEQDAAGIIEEIHARMLKDGHALPHLKPEIRLNAGYTFSYIDPDWFNLIIFDMMEEDKVNLLLHTLVVDVTKDGDKITGIVVENANGRNEIKGKVVIDCTGEGDIATRAGAPFEMVDRETIQPHSVSFTADGVDWERVLEYIRSNPDQFTYFELTLPDMSKEQVEEVRQKALEVYSHVTDVTELGEVMGFFKLRDKGLETGEWHKYSGVGFFLTPREGGHIQAHFQHSAQVPNVLPTDAWDLTKGEIECRKQIQIAWKFFKKYVPGFENAYITKVCPEMRIREGRRIMGDYKLTRDDVAEGKKICRCHRQEPLQGRCASRRRQQHDCADEQVRSEGRRVPRYPVSLPCSAEGGEYARGGQDGFHRQRRVFEIRPANDDHGAGCGRCCRALCKTRHFAQSAGEGRNGAAEDIEGAGSSSGRNPLIATSKISLKSEGRA